MYMLNLKGRNLSWLSDMKALAEKHSLLVLCYQFFNIVSWILPIRDRPHGPAKFNQLGFGLSCDISTGRRFCCHSSVLYGLP